MQKTSCKYGQKRPCCSAIFCPLIPAWATTIHKFQGFEAGKDPWDAIQNLIVDCGDQSAENRCPGLLYFAVSRAKMLGEIVGYDSFPTDSALYFERNICNHRVMHCSTRFDKSNPDERIEKENITNRNLWVQFLLDRAQITREKIFTKQVLAQIENDTMLTALNNKCASVTEVKVMIANMLTHPNPTWQQKRSKYTIEKSFFD